MIVLIRNTNLLQNPTYYTTYMLEVEFYLFGYFILVIVVCRFYSKFFKDIDSSKSICYQTSAEINCCGSSVEEGGRRPFQNVNCLL